MVRLIYSTVFSLALPFILLSKLWRSRQAPAYRQRWGERLGKTTCRGPYEIWVHAVSLGEANVAIPLVESLQQALPEARILVTTTTPTGSVRIQAVLGQRVDHCYLPFDIPWLLSPWIKLIQAKRLLIIETELWPNLIHIAHNNGCEIYLMNARLSEKSARGYARIAKLTTSMLQSIKGIASQDAASTQRFMDLGYSAEKIKTLGSIKFDVQQPADIARFKKDWQTSLGQRPIWIAASTHPGEDEIILAAHKRVLQRLPNACLILAPRHPERFKSVAKLIEGLGLDFTSRSQIDRSNKIETSCLLLDSLGELLYFFSVADIAFIGGSLIAGGGGHNPLEAAIHAKPLLTGPYFRDFKAIYERLLEREAAKVVNNIDELQQQVLYFFKHTDICQRTGTQALQLVEDNQGATVRQVNFVLD